MYVQLLENGSLLESCYDDKAKELFNLYLDCFYNSTTSIMGEIKSRVRSVSNRVRQIVYTWTVSGYSYKLTVIYDYLRQ